jgi:hypothetical protein
VHRLVSFVALVTHMVFVAFTVLGGFLAWLVPWVLVAHIASALWGARMAAWRRACPLSVAENWGRAGSGRATLHDRGFIAHYFEDRLYPAAWSRRIELLMATLVVGSWIGFAVH